MSKTNKQTKQQQQQQRKQALIINDNTNIFIHY